jgi:hypothetical protein
MSSGISCNAAPGFWAALLWSASNLATWAPKIDADVGDSLVSSNSGGGFGVR